MVQTPTDWIEWQGGECPVDPETRVDVRHADETVTRDVAAGDCRDVDPNYGFDWWKHFDTPDHAHGFIIAYRVVQS